ncbi:hypothetical protein D3C84_1207550 [compost metagenome]
MVARLRIRVLASSLCSGSTIVSLRLPWAMRSAMRLAARRGLMMLRITQRPWTSSNNRLAKSTAPRARLALPSA